MAYSVKHKTITRQRILHAANRLFTAKGYERTSIDEIMHACGLTRGGFYAHFSNKGQLYREALALRRPFDSMLADYLNAAGPATSTLPAELSFLAIDVASETPEVRTAYTELFMSMSDRLSGQSTARTHASESLRLSAAALIVGTLAVAHTTDNPSLRAKLLAACMESAGAMLGGQRQVNPHFFWEPVLS